MPLLLGITMALNIVLANQNASLIINIPFEVANQNASLIINIPFEGAKNK
jgi:hypothetical protein